MNCLHKQNNKLYENIEHYSTEHIRRFLGHNVISADCKMRVNSIFLYKFLQTKVIYTVCIYSNPLV